MSPIALYKQGDPIQSGKKWITLADRNKHFEFGLKVALKRWNVKIYENERLNGS